MTTMESSYPRSLRRARRSEGFTLIELMITVAIIAILAAVAIPSYRDSVWKGKRGEAKAAILRTIQTEERWYTQNNQYLPYPTPPLPKNAPFSTFSADNAANSRYAMSAQAGPLTVKGPPSGGNVVLCPTPNNTIDKCVIVKATVLGSPDPDCGNALYIDSMGSKGSTAVPNPYKEVCWK